MHRVSRILQRAICAAADEEYARLTVRMTNDECAARILRAIDSLDQLRYGVPPIYDQWVALLYITWYQYGHVNLAGAILNELFHRQPVREPIHVIDLGCGAMAAQIALAGYSATVKAPRKSVHTITVHNIDPSEPMKRIGQKVWEHVRRISRREFLSLSRACDSIESRSLSSHEEMGDINSPGKRILVAMHAIYNENIRPIKKSINNIYRDYKPGEIVISCHNEGYKLAVTLDHRQPEVFRQTEMKWIFTPSPDEITDWRRNLHQMLRGAKVDDWVWKYWTYLDRPVPTNPKSAIFLRWASDNQP